MSSLHNLKPDAYESGDLRRASEKVSMMYQNTKDRLETVTNGCKTAINNLTEGLQEKAYSDATH